MAERWNEGKLLVVRISKEEAKHLMGSKDGRSWDFWTQECHAASGQEYPNAIELRLPVAGQPYKPGLYLLGAGTLSSGRKGIFIDTGMPLVPVSDAVEELRHLVDGASVPSARPVSRAA